MKRIFIIIVLLILAIGTYLIFFSDRIASQPAGPGDNCKANPAFMSKVRMRQPQLDTANRSAVGMVLYDGANPGAQPVQKESWKKFGALGAITRDETGAVYTASVPLINTLSTTSENHLAVLRIDSKTGELESWAKLSGPSLSKNNYYGITSLAYDCTTHLLYASAVAGSSQDKQTGFIAAIDVKTAQEKFRYTGIDTLGIGIFGGKNGRHLYLGLARNANVVRLPLTAEGKLFGSPESVLAFDEFNRTRARKIIFNPTGLQLHTTEFYYNLIASTEFEQRQLQYRYNAETDKFSLEPPQPQT